MEEINPKNLKFILYARKSTEASDKQVRSINDQIRIMKERAKRDGLHIVATLHESISGGKAGRRPEFEKAMTMIENGEADAFLAWKTDRLSRNPLDSGRIHQDMLDGRLKLIITSDKTYTPEDDLLFDIESSVNARYRKDLAKNVNRGMTSKAKDGWFPGMPPVGYLNDRLDKIIIRDDESADKVNQVFEKFATGTMSLAEATRYGEEIGLRTHQRKKIGGQPLTLTGMRNMLSNVFYIGRFTYAGKEYNGKHPSIVNEKTFERVQEILNALEHSVRPQGEDPKKYLFSGMLKCAECGFAIVSETKHKRLSDGTIREYVYCHCTGKNKECPNCPQKHINIRQEELESQIRDELAKYTIDDDFYHLAIEALQEEEDARIEGQKEQKAKYDRQLSSLNTQLNSLRRMRYRGEISDERWYMDESRMLENEISNIQKKINNVMDVARNWRAYADDVFMFARYAKEDFDKGTLEQKQYVMKALGGELTLSGRTVQFFPSEFLIPIKKAVAKTASLDQSGRTTELQGSNRLIDGKNHRWCYVTG